MSRAGQNNEGVVPKVSSNSEENKFEFVLSQFAEVSNCESQLYVSAVFFLLENLLNDITIYI
jgi:hypothetical protein